MFAFKVKVLEISIRNTNEQLAKSGVLEKNNEINDVKKHIEALKILVEAQFESLKEIKDTNRDLAYIFWKCLFGSENDLSILYMNS